MAVFERIIIDSFYKALVDRDRSYVGIFYVGVKTTNVFCIPTCRARKPKKHNVEFFTTFKEALAHGYRPCKICKPTENVGQTPEQVETAIRLVKENPKDKITDFKLRENNVSPESVRRWFNTSFGMTFQAYQRMNRINNAFQELKNGKKATVTAFDTGYESLSGFGYTFKKIVGQSPRKSSGKSIILINRFTTPLGPMFVCATDNGVCLLEFVDRRMLETEFKDLQRLLNAQIIIGENEHTNQATNEIAEYFDGKRTKFDVRLETPGTVFQNLVWNCLKEIKHGRTISYQEQANKLGMPKAVRAVACANGFNRVAIVVPCHRVIGKDGKLTGYGGGIERKRWLIQHEQKIIGSGTETTAGIKHI